MFQELCQVLFIVIPLFAIAGVVLMIDPQKASFNRQFYFAWLLDGVILIHWFVMAGQQFLHIYNQNRMMKQQDSKVVQAQRRNQHSKSFSPAQHFLQLLDDQPAAKQKFEEYAAKLYAVENVHFVFDVRSSPRPRIPFTNLKFIFKLYPPVSRDLRTRTTFLKTCSIAMTGRLSVVRSIP